MSRCARAFKLLLIITAFVIIIIVPIIIIIIVAIVTIAKFKVSHMCKRYAVKVAKKKKGKTDDTAVKTGKL